MRSLTVLIFALLFTASQAQARLDIVSLKHDGKDILYIKDRVDDNRNNNDGIEAGDANRIRSAIKRRPYAQVWLRSGGGNLEEGVKIGMVLRENSAFVRVKSGDHCVSACTVAFLGGLLRTVDRGATYEVHSYSVVLSGFRKNLQNRIKDDPETYIKQFAARQYQESAPYWSAGLFEYIRQMILSPPNSRVQQYLNTRSHTRRKNQIANAIQQDYNTYLEGPFTLDTQRSEREGLGASHDIVMRLEREAMLASLNYLDGLAANNELGNRAAPALRILRTMFESSILSTSSLNQSTLREYGYTNVASTN